MICPHCVVVVIAFIFGYLFRKFRKKKCEDCEAAKPEREAAYARHEAELDRIRREWDPEHR